jgi:hypothetical protein
MDRPLTFKLEHLDELDRMEFEQQMRAAGVKLASPLKASKSEIPKDAFGVPPEVSLLIEVARDTLPALLGIVALWIAKGRTKGQGRKVAFSWTKDGLAYEKVSYEHESETDDSDKIKAALQAKISGKI